METLAIKIYDKINLDIRVFCKKTEKKALQKCDFKCDFAFLANFISIFQDNLGLNTTSNGFDNMSLQERDSYISTYILHDSTTAFSFFIPCVFRGNY